MVEVPSGSSLLVVRGMITDQPGPYQVRLSRSNNLNNPEFPMETGASVTIESQSGEIELLVEEAPGYYSTAENGIRGEIGEHYRLVIVTGDERQYQSDWKLLKASPEMDSVYFEYQEQETLDGLLKGLQTFVDVDDPNNATTYYRYEWLETWEVRADLPAYFEYLGNDERVLIPANEFCWNSEASSTISIASSAQNTTDIISRHPILFVTTGTSRLRWLYSLLVRQYALDQQEYLFWKSLQETAVEPGTLFDKQPQSVTGNLSSINSDEPVLGYFSASAVAEKRIFLSLGDLPEGSVIDRTLTRQCFDGQVEVGKSPTSEAEIQELLDVGLVFFDWIVSPGAGIVGYIFTQPICSDCTEQGGITEKPDYWP